MDIKGLEDRERKREGCGEKRLGKRTERLGWPERGSRNARTLKVSVLSHWAAASDSVALLLVSLVPLSDCLIEVARLNHYFMRHFVCRLISSLLLIVFTSSCSWPRVEQQCGPGP